MTRQETLARLVTVAPAMRRLGAAHLYLFGSTLRDEARSDSDVDLFLDPDPNGRFSLLDLVAARRMIEEALGRPVDLATRDGLHPRIRSHVEREAERIF